jgi:hypothetical protein
MSDLQIPSTITVVVQNFLLVSQNSTQNESTDEPLNTSKAPKTISDIKTEIRKLNKAQDILNLEKFGPLQSDSVVIIVQVFILFAKVDKLSFFRTLSLKVL